MVGKRIRKGSRKQLTMWSKGGGLGGDDCSGHPELEKKELAKQGGGKRPRVKRWIMYQKKERKTGKKKVD